MSTSLLQPCKAFLLHAVLLYLLPFLSATSDDACVCQMTGKTILRPARNNVYDIPPTHITS
jgi:hypothetical protein